MKWKRIISAILAFSVVLSLFPQTGYTEGEEDVFYYNPVELWSYQDINYNNYKTPLGDIDSNIPASVIKVFSAKDDIDDNANVYPKYLSYIKDATGELKNISYRSYLNLMGYDLRKWCKGSDYAGNCYNYPIEKTLPEAISSLLYKNYSASYWFTLDDQSMLYEYDYSSTPMKVIPHTYSNTTNMFRKKDFMMAVPYEAFSLSEKKDANDIANTLLVGMTTVTSQTDSWIRYCYTDKSIGDWRSIVRNGVNYGRQLSFYGTGETRNNKVNRAKFQNIGVYLRDIQGPKVTKVSFTKIDPLVKPEWNAEISSEFNTNDDYMYISLKFDEPVKFKNATAADPSALKDMTLVFNTVGVDGSSGEDKTAKFYRYTPAQNDPTPTMVFKYKLPEDKYFRISEININDSKNKTFFENLTDVSGNPFGMNINTPTAAVAQRLVVSELPVVDTQKPKLLTPDMSSSNGGAYLSANSCLTVNVNFSEIMKTVNSNNPNAALNDSLILNLGGNVVNIAAETNLKDSSGNNVLILPSDDCSGSGEYYAIYNGKYSVRKIGSLNAPDSSSISLGYKIPEGCYLPEGEAIVKVMGIKQLAVDETGHIKKVSGNPVILDSILIEDIHSNKMDLSSLNLSSAQQLKVDTDKPVLSVTGPMEADGNAIANPKQILYFMVSAEDMQPGKLSSGFSGQTASFYFGTQSNYGKNSGFDYAVLENVNTASINWQHTDADNVTAKFPLMDNQSKYYIAIKLADKTIIDKINYECTVSDNAENKTTVINSNIPYSLDTCAPLLTVLDETKLIIGNDGKQYFNAGVYARDDSDFKVFYAWKDAAATAEPDWAIDADVKELTLGDYQWGSNSNLNYTVRYGNIKLAAEADKISNKQLWIRAVDKNGLVTTAPVITGFLADTRIAHVDVLPVTPTDRLTTGTPIAKLHIDTKDINDLKISYRWVQEKTPGVHSWVTETFSPGVIDYYERESYQWTTTSASALSFDGNGDLSLTMSNVRLFDDYGGYNIENASVKNCDVTLYVKAEINGTTAYKAVTFKVVDTAENSYVVNNDNLYVWVTPYFCSLDSKGAETKHSFYDDQNLNDRNVISLDEKDKVEAEIRYSFRTPSSSKMPLSQELVDLGSPDTKLELLRFRIKDAYINDPNVNGNPNDFKDKLFYVLRNTTGINLSTLTKDMYTEEVVYSEKITESQMKVDASETGWKHLKISADLPSYLFKSASWKEGDPLEVYCIRASVARKPVYDITLGKYVQPKPIVNEYNNIIFDNTQIEQGSITSVKNKSGDTKAVTTGLKAKAAKLVFDANGTSFTDETTNCDRIYVSEEYPEITFRTMGAFFEGRAADIIGYDDIEHKYARTVARIRVGTAFYANGSIENCGQMLYFTMAPNKAVTIEGSTATYKAYDCTINGMGKAGLEGGDEAPVVKLEQLKLKPGENKIYYQFYGANGTTSTINTVTIILDQSKPDIIFKAMPAPTTENPDLVTSTEVKAGVDYAIDNIVVENGKSIVGTPSDKIVITSKAYYGDTAPGTFSYDEAALTAPRKNSDGSFTFKQNGNIIATATDELGNSTTETYKIDWIDTQAPVFTAYNQSGTDKINLSAAVTDNRSADEIGFMVTFDDTYTKYLLGVDNLTEDNRWIPMASGSNMPGLISSSASNGTATLQAYIKTGDNSPVPNKAVVKAADRAGNSSTKDIELTGITAVKPAITDSSYNSNDGFTITFNQPVKLKNLTSDANEPVKYTAVALHKKVSIYADGNYQVTYIDVFGQEHSETITADIFGIAYKHSVMLSNSRPTQNPVTVTLDATMTEGIYLQLPDETIGAVKKTGVATVKGTSVCKKMEIILDENKTFTYNLISSGNLSQMAATFSLTNIDKATPVANCFRKLDGSEMFNADGSKSITGTVSYQILGFNEENVVMADGSPSTYTFDKAGVYTFVFTDEAGNRGSLTVTETGTFTPKAVANDTTPPDYSLSYSAAGKEMMMLNSADNKKYISGTSVPVIEKVSGDVTVDIGVIDDNPVTMTVLSDGGGLVKYAAGQHVLTFTNNAAAQVRLTDAKNNTTIVNIKVDCIDKTAPTGVINYEVQTDRTVIAYLESYSSDAKVLNSPGMQYNDTLKKYYYHFTGNGTSVFTLQDEAGNLGNAIAKVVSIDIAAPEIVEGNTTWNPSALNNSHAAPAGIKTNSNVTVFFLMSERISAVDIGVAEPANVTDISPYINYSFAAASLMVEFKQNCQISLILIDLAGNKSKSILVPDAKLSVIDKEAPMLKAGSPSVEIKDNKAVYTYEFNEPVKLVSEKGSDNFFVKLEKVYEQNASYSHTFADEAGNTMTTTVNVDQLDLTAPSFKYVIKGSAGDSAIGNTGLSTTNKPVTLIITPSESCTLNIGRRGDRIKFTYKYSAGVQSQPIEYTVSTNGVYEINAADAVGNKSTGMIAINFIDTEAPRITLSTGSSYNLTQNANAVNTDLTAVLAKLKAEATASDVIDGACEVSVTGLTIDDLKNEGDYTVSFTAVDKAGNTGTATRKVKVYSSTIVFFNINGKDAAVGAVTTLNERLIAIIPPEAIRGAFKLSYKRGYQTMAQMKYGATAIKDNSFTADEPGYYTILVQSTDRAAYVTYIYVAK